MRLADLILEYMETILSRWEEFARHSVAGSDSMKSLALRDHAQQLLEAVAKELTTPQSGADQLEKFDGENAQTGRCHGDSGTNPCPLREQSGFDINQLIAESRALRASVLHLCTDKFEPGRHHVEDIVRFNETIDQAIAE